MKNIKYILYIFTLLLFTGCNDSFMDRYPETSITEKYFFNTVQDLTTYTNSYYGYVDYQYGYEPSDDTYENQEPDLYRILRDELTPETASDWNWGSIRNINFFMNHYDTAVGSESEINHYVGFTRLMRAWEYYKKVRQYSNVPWVEHDLTTSSVEALYKTQDSREFVVDKILEDLDFAVNNIPESASKTRHNRWTALALQARIALEEASWRKYHPELELSDYERFYKIAEEACKTIIEEGDFKLNRVGTKEHSAYKMNFVNTDLSQNPEMIMYADFNPALRRNNAQAMFNNYHGFSRDIMEDFYYIENNQAIPFTHVPNYETKSFLEVFENRDARFADIFMKPGFIRSDSHSPAIPQLGLGGYPMTKFDPLTGDQIGWNMSYTDIPIIRYAEILLMYAEAKAEMGILTEADVELTINDIRNRVGTPGTTLNAMLSNIDPKQEEKYPNVTGTQKGAILEVRRERRIEMAGESKRLKDVYRWGIGKRLENFEGIYIPSIENYLDFTGDGKPDVAIVKTQAEADAIPEADKEKYKLNIYILDSESTFLLSEGDHGYVRITALRDNLRFVGPKYYYYPISTSDKVLNENLVQNKFW